MRGTTFIFHSAMPKLPASDPITGIRRETLTGTFTKFPKKLSALRLKSHVLQSRSEGNSQHLLPLSGGGTCVLLSVFAFLYTSHTTIVNRSVFVNSSFHFRLVQAVVPSRHLLLLQHLQKYLHQLRVKLRSRTAAQFRLGILLVHGFVVRSVMHHHIVGVHYRDNAG